MILSPYSNPPYRTPTSRTTSSSSPPPPNNHSPKRKRNDSTESLHINTQLQVEQTPDVSGSNSPRTKVADKFQQLDIRPSSRPPTYAGKGASGRGDGGRKRMKRSPLPTELSRSEGGIGDGTGDAIHFSQLDRTPADDLFATGIDEVGETPDRRTREARPSPAPRDPPSPDGSVAVVIPLPEATRTTKPRLRSPPPPSHTSPTSITAPERTLSPLPSIQNLTPDQAALTWQDSEITGHELDPSGDDDGEGINGIGFRPTTAMAWARQRRRREQVAEWKAREAREARLRRVERRRGERGTGGVEGAGKRRVVRFADG